MGFFLEAGRGRCVKEGVLGIFDVGLGGRGKRVFCFVFQSHISMSSSIYESF